MGRLVSGGFPFATMWYEIPMTDLFAQQANTRPLTSAEQTAKLKALAEQARDAGPDVAQLAAIKAKLGTDQLAIAQPEHQYFGHRPKVVLSLILKQPIWQDDRTKITPEQWNQMPAAQQDEILKMMPTDAARNQFTAYMDPAAVAARAWAGAAAKGLVKAIAKGAAASAEREAAEQAAAAAKAQEAEQAVQVDRLNALVEASEKTRK